MPTPKLVSLKYTPAEQKDEAGEYTTGPNGQPAEYPWGLQIRLEQEEFDKLGIKPPELDSELHLFCIAKVTSVSRETAGDNEVCASLQITMMAVTGEGDAAEEAGEDAAGKQTPEYEMKEARPGLASLLSYYTAR